MYIQHTNHTLFPYGAQSDSKTYLMRDEKKRWTDVQTEDGLRLRRSEKHRGAGRSHWGRSNSKGRTHTETKREGFVSKAASS